MAVLDRKILLAAQKWRELLKMRSKFQLNKNIHLMMFQMGFGQKTRLVRCSQTGLHLVQETGNLNQLKR